MKLNIIVRNMFTINPSMISNTYLICKKCLKSYFAKNK